MLKNYLIVAVRNLLRHKGYSAINILGLAVGMACCVLILLYVQDELSYDRQHENADRIFRVIRETQRNDGRSYFGEGSPGALALALRNDFPEIQQVVRTWARGRWIRHGDKGFQQIVCLADPEILEVFTFPLMGGDPRTVLREPASMLITAETARKFFGSEDPIGKVVNIDDIDYRGAYKITGILRDIPQNMYLRFDFLTSTVATPYARDRWEEWQHETSWHPIQNYILLRSGQSAEELQRKLVASAPRYRSEKDGAPITYRLQALKRIRLYSARDYGLQVGGNVDAIYTLSLMAFFILLIACINFMNLATARSARRSREVGMRKVIGAQRVQLIRQFLGESVFLAFLALLLSVALIELALPEFNAFVDKRLSLWAAPGGSPLLFLAGVAVFAGLLAGCYPALFLSAFRPVEVLKGTLKIGPRGGRFRKGLVVFQFSVSIFLIIATAVVYDQMAYVQKMDLGFDKEQVVVMPLFYTDRALDPSNSTGDGGRLTGRYLAVKQAFLQHPNVLKASASRGLPGWGWRFDVVLPEGEEGKKWLMNVYPADEDFLDLFEIPLLAGRNLSKDIPTDATQAYLLNETAVRQLGWTDPIGKQFEWVAGEPRKGRVVGVVKDFQTRSLREKVGPAVICMQPKVLHWLSLKIRHENVPATLAFIESRWKEFIPSRPCDYFFLDEQLNEMYYWEEMRLGKIFRAASLLAIFVACLGLFGLASFAAEQRTKEIGVRKTLGATVSNIAVLLSKDHLALVMAANLIAWPVAYYAMSRWLRDFAYRIELGPGTFVLAGVLALFIALLTVSAQAIKAALANPVDALRYE